MADGRADAPVSAGSTGPALAAATLSIKRSRRPPARSRRLVPIPGKPVLFLDCGANVEVRPEHLVQFAYMGAGFMEAVHGAEPERRPPLRGRGTRKGTPDVLEAGRRLEEGDLNFVGNLEASTCQRRRRRDRQRRLHGNVALKVLEGTSRVVRDAIRERIRSGLVSSLGGLLIKRNVERLREVDPEAVGGAILLGLRKPVVVGHGRFGPKGIVGAIQLARRAVDERMVERPGRALGRLGLRSAGAASVGSR